MLAANLKWTECFLLSILFRFCCSKRTAKKLAISFLLFYFVKKIQRRYSIIYFRYYLDNICKTNFSCVSQEEDWWNQYNVMYYKPLYPGGDTVTPCLTTSENTHTDTQLKIRHSAVYFWRTSRCLKMWSNTVLSGWYIFSINEFKYQVPNLFG